MLTWLHNYIPQPILWQWGWLSVYWYGFIIAIAVVLGFIISTKIAKQRGFNKELWFDMLFYSMISGLIGARLYHVILELPYYITHPFAIFSIWQGGLAIHGAIIGGGIAVFYFAKKNKWEIAKVFDILAISLILGQAMGRWGNFFNQELFGLPTNRPWGIFIEVINRPESYAAITHFHPTFLYESIANFVLFIILIVLYKNKHTIAGLITSIYLVGYSIIRFCLEFVRIDRTPELWGLRWPQWASFIIVILVFIYWWRQKGLPCKKFKNIH